MAPDLPFGKRIEGFANPDQQSDLVDVGIQSGVEPAPDKGGALRQELSRTRTEGGNLTT